MTTRTDHALIDLLDASGLTGRGGAAFSTVTKLRAAQQHGADLIVNACDGELGATKDAWVVSHHLAEVVEGPVWSPPSAAGSGMPRTGQCDRGHPAGGRAGRPRGSGALRLLRGERTHFARPGRFGAADDQTGTLRDWRS